MFTDEAQIVKNNLVATIPRLYKEFDVSFEVFPTGFLTGSYPDSIIHMTIGPDQGKYGARTPGIWFNSNKLHIDGAVNGQNEYNLLSPKGYALDTWLKIKVGQYLSNNAYRYIIQVNDEVLLSTVNTKPAVFDDVKVYVGSPWWDPQAGKIRKLVINNRAPAG